jgi:hypothetical protein
VTQPTPFNRTVNFTDYSAAFPLKPQRGDWLDAEFNGVELTLDELCTNISLIQRDDGAVRNKTIGVDQLADSALALIGGDGFVVRGPWATATAYSLGDMVSDSGTILLCVIAHTSGTLATDVAAGRFVMIFDVGAALAPVDSVITASIVNGAVTPAKLAASGVATGTYGAAVNTSPVVTFNAGGQATSASNRKTAVASIAELAALDIATLPNGLVVNVLGYYAAGDGGGGAFILNAASTATDDGGLVINMAGNAGAGRWLRVVWSNTYQAKWWGAKSEDGFDNRPPVQRAIDALTADTYSYNVLTAGYGNLRGATLEFGPGRWDFLTNHPIYTSNVLVMVKPLNIVGAGRDRTHWMPQFSTVKWTLWADPNPSADPLTANYAIGGSFKGIAIRGDGGAVWQSGIRVSATNPTAWDGFYIADFMMNNVFEGVRMEGIGSTTVYGCVVERGKILGVAAGGNGMHDLNTAYNTWRDIDIYEDVSTPGSMQSRISASFNITCQNVRWQGCAIWDAPFGVAINCGVEGGFDFTAGSNIAWQVQRFGSIDGAIINNVGNVDFQSIVRTSAILATATTTRPHGLTSGDTIKIYNAVPANFNNGNANTVVTVTGPTTFTYPLLADPVTNATTVGYYAAVTGTRLIYGLLVTGQTVSVDGVTFTGKQPGIPFVFTSTGTGTARNIACNNPPALKPETQMPAADWRKARIFDSPTLTDYGWDVATVTSLPAASDLARGIQRMLLVGGASPDRFVVCRRDGGGAFAWVDLF